MTIDRLLTPHEVADRLQVTVATVREWLRTGQLKGRRINGRWRVDRSALARFEAGDTSTLTCEAVPALRAEIEAELKELAPAFDAPDYATFAEVAQRISHLASDIRAAQEMLPGIVQVRKRLI